MGRHFLRSRWEGVGTAALIMLTVEQSPYVLRNYSKIHTKADKRI